MKLLLLLFAALFLVLSNPDNLVVEGARTSSSSKVKEIVEVKRGNITVSFSDSTTKSFRNLIINGDGAIEWEIKNTGNNEFPEGVLTVDHIKKAMSSLVAPTGNHLVIGRGLHIGQLIIPDDVNTYLIKLYHQGLIEQIHEMQTTGAAKGRYNHLRIEGESVMGLFYGDLPSDYVAPNRTTTPPKKGTGAGANAAKNKPPPTARSSRPSRETLFESQIKKK